VVNAIGFPRLSLLFGPLYRDVSRPDMSCPLTAELCGEKTRLTPPSLHSQ